MKTDAFSDPTYRATLLRASPSPGPQAQAQGSIRGLQGGMCSLQAGAFMVRSPALQGDLQGDGALDRSPELL